jgi:hypothetical protein
MIPPLTIDYPVDPNARYGPRYGNTRPYVLPAGVRHTSKPGAAASYVVREVRRIWAGAGAGHAPFADIFAVSVVNIAETASRMMFALPGDHIGPHFSFWGVFQFDRPKWQAATARHLQRRQDAPWQATAIEEIVIPILAYRSAADAVLAVDGPATFMARGVWLWHLAEAAFAGWLMEARREGSFEQAWRNLGEHAARRAERDLAGFIDAQLGRCGILAD